jgi:hypothetical protein
MMNDLFETCPRLGGRAAFPGLCGGSPSGGFNVRVVEFGAARFFPAEATILVEAGEPGTVGQAGRGGSIALTPGVYRVTEAERWGERLQFVGISVRAGHGGNGRDGQVIIRGPVSIEMPCGERVVWGPGVKVQDENVLCACGDPSHVVLAVREPEK